MHIYFNSENCYYYAETRTEAGRLRSHWLKPDRPPGNSG